MAVLNHTIVSATDAAATARFFTEVLGLEPAIQLGPFHVLTVGDYTSLDVTDSPDPIHPQHYAFLVTEREFDEIFGRIQERNLPYWADPMRNDAGRINHWDDGRGVYFDDPDGHLLEIITRPYGSGGAQTQHPHPLTQD